MPDEVTGLDRIGMPVDVDEEEGTIGTYSLFSASDHMNEISILSYFWHYCKTFLCNIARNENVDTHELKESDRFLRRNLK